MNREHMKVLLLKVPYCPHPDSEVSSDFRAHNSFRPLPSLALAALGAWVREQHDIKLVDLNMLVYEKPGEPVNTNKLPDVLSRTTKEAQYDILCISAMFAYNIKWVRDTVSLSRSHHPKARIVIGGGLATLFPAEIASPGVACIPGEGEVALGHLLDGNWGGSWERLGDLGGLPPPAWDLLDVKGFFERSGEHTLPIEASRGCPYNCSYCTVTGTWGSRVRYKDISQVMREIKLAVDVHGATKLHFVDDNLAFDKKWFKGFLHAFINSGIQVQLDASNFSVLHLDQKIADLLVKAGFKRICVAVESGSPAVLEKIRKRINLTCIPEKVGMLRAAGLWVHLCWMVGFPGETKAQIAQTLDLVRQLRAESNQILTVVPYPGTDLYREAKQAGMLGDVALDQLDCRQAELLIHQEWDYAWLREVVYDTNIHVNFMNNICLERKDPRFLTFLEDLLIRLPEHLIARLLAGWLGDREKHWTYLRGAILSPALKPFTKYFAGEHPALQEFRTWLGEQA